LPVFSALATRIEPQQCGLFFLNESEGAVGGDPANQKHAAERRDKSTGFPDSTA